MRNPVEPVSPAQPINIDELRWALGDGDIPVLLMVLVHLTGDLKYLDPPFRPRRDVRLFPDESGGLPPTVQASIRDAVVTAVDTYNSGVASIEELDDELFAQMMSTCVGEPVPTEYVPLFADEMQLAATPSAQPPSGSDDGFNVVVIGAGVSGLLASIKLEMAGIDHVVLDKNADLGGTWWENTYPEAGVDTPNHFYSYSFEPNLDWSSYFSKREEIWDYLHRCVDVYGIRHRLHFGLDVVSSSWNHDEQAWTTVARRNDGSTVVHRSSMVISAVGLLNRPKLPTIAGLETYSGEIFHTARWRHDVDLTGRRVALIGTGASAMQAARTVAARSEHLTIFQRSPQWVAPSPDYHRAVSTKKRWLLTHLPGYAEWYRFVLFWRYGDGLHPSLFIDPDWPHQDRSLNRRNDRHREFLATYMVEQLAGRDDLLAKVMPDYPPYGKRMLMDNDWFKTLRRDDVTLVVEPIEEITPTGIRTNDGTVHPADVVIVASGFETTRMLWPLEVTGRDGLRIEDEWEIDNPRAYKGTTVPGFPNFMIMHGPNTALAHGGSVIFHSECQMRYVMDCIDTIRRRGIAAVDCRREAFEDYNEHVDAAHAQMVWSHPGMTNWYRNGRGRVVANSPWRLVDIYSMLRTFDVESYDCLERRG